MLQIRPVRDQDCRLLWEWVNESEARASAFQSAAIPWDTHVAWFSQKLRDPSCRMYLMMHEDGRPLAQVRFDVQPDESAQVDVSVVRACRGQGYGAAALRLACRTLFADSDIRHIVAWIRPGNSASIRAFTRSGFVVEGGGLVRGKPAVKMRMDRADVPGERGDHLR